MNKVTFEVLGEPKGKGRPRFKRAGKYVSTYTPEETVLYENLIKIEYRRQCGTARFDDDKHLLMEIYAFMSIPKSTSKKKVTQMLMELIRPKKKPDMDNIAKAVADSLNGIAYKDDSQVADLVIRKFYSDIPRIVVNLYSDYEMQVVVTEQQEKVM